MTDAKFEKRCDKSVVVSCPPGLDTLDQVHDTVQVHDWLTSNKSTNHKGRSMLSRCCKKNLVNAIKSQKLTLDPFRMLDVQGFSPKEKRQSGQWQNSVRTFCLSLIKICGYQAMEND